MTEIQLPKKYKDDILDMLLTEDFNEVIRVLNEVIDEKNAKSKERMEEQS